MFIPRRLICVLVAILALSAAAAGTAAEPVAYLVPIEELAFTAGPPPNTEYTLLGWREQIRSNWMLPSASAVGLEVFVDGAAPSSGELRGQLRLLLRGPAFEEAQGMLYLPVADRSRLERHAFRYRPQAKHAVTREKAAGVVVEHYHRLVDRPLAGGAWFRWKMAEARQAQGLPATLPSDDGPGGRGGRLAGGFQFFSGVGAVHENLALDQMLRIGSKDDRALIDVDALRGITIREIDWTQRNAGLAPKHDVLAKAIPADQHVAFFPTATDLARLQGDGADFSSFGAWAWETRSSMPRSFEHYRRQLCLQVADLVALTEQDALGRIAITGSDLYLHEGTDVAILFEVKKAEAVDAFFRQRYGEVVAKRRDVRLSGTLENRNTHEVGSGLTTPDRAISSHYYRVDGLGVVTNSQTQLMQIRLALEGRAPAVSTLAEYTFFRDRYPHDAPQEDAFVILSDPAIRRWCGPLWRIAHARGLEAAAVMSQVQAKHLDELVRGVDGVRQLENPWPMRDLTQLSLTPSGVRSLPYGRLELRTPIRELGLRQVTLAEANAYHRWRQEFERTWQSFDPIAGTITATDTQLDVDFTVMPLTLSSQFQQYGNLNPREAIAPDAGDQHPSALVHAIVRIPSNNFIDEWGLDTLEFYVDADPLLAKLQGVEDFEHWYREHRLPLPVALRATFRPTANPQKVAEIFNLIRMYLLRDPLEEKEHAGQKYWLRTKKDDPNFDHEPSVLAVAHGERTILLTLSESVMQHALEREATRKKGDALPEPGYSWQGETMAAFVRAEGISLLNQLFLFDYRRQLQLASWSNIPILNEWKRRYPDRDPIAFHAQFWNEHLVCPGGGKYVWNETWQTLESTVFGHPGEPKWPAELATPLARYRSISVGATVEPDGLRGRVQATRVGKD